MSRHGKGVILRKLSESEEACYYARILQNPNAAIDDVSVAGQKLMLLLYGATVDDNLAYVRYSTYCKLLLRRNFKVERLPPSPRAAYYHALRVHLQVIDWESLGKMTLDALDWGWKVCEGELQPIETDKPAGPDDLLKFVRCKCTKDCSSMLCSCRRNGLRCVTACSHCNEGEGCSNAAEMDEDIGGSDSDVETSEPLYFYDEDLDYQDEEIIE